MLGPRSYGQRVNDQQTVREPGYFSEFLRKQIIPGRLFYGVAKAEHRLRQEVHVGGAVTPSFHNPKGGSSIPVLRTPFSADFMQPQ